jgi:hypothetical protein
MVKSVTRKVCGCGAAIVALSFLGISLAEAAEIRVVDSAGLVRAVRVVQRNSRIVITIQGGSGSSHGECVATNIDGLSAEKRVLVSPKGECVFNDMPVGSWHVTVPGKESWRAQIYE